MNQQDELEKLVLETLSLFDYFNLERIFLEFEENDLLVYPDFNRSDLEELLKSLTADKKLCQKRVNGEIYWKKNFPQRKSFIKRIFAHILK